MGKVGAAAACFGIWCRRLGERARAPHRPTLFILAWERAKRAAAVADDWALGALPLRTYESHAPTRGGAAATKTAKTNYKRHAAAEVQPYRPRPG